MKFINKKSIEHILCQEVMQNIQNYHRLVLAFSGGLDSTVLLDILYTINKNIQCKIYNTNIFTLRAIYIHHKLNPNADHWAQHCFKECNKRKIQFTLIHAHCHNKSKYGGTEAAARKIRYQKLFNNLYKNEILLTAQHLDDQAETFLLALKRGSGPAGLSGMIKNRKYQHQLLRPLLQCTKEQITLYAKNKKLTWITDDSNLETRFDRNFLRLNILPILKNRWPKINYTISRSAKLCAEQEDLLDELLQEELHNLYHSDQSLLLKPFINMSIQKRQALIRRWLSTFNIQMPSYKKLHHIWKNIILSKQDSAPIIELDQQYLLRRFQNRLYIVSKAIQNPLNNIIIQWENIKTKIILPNDLGILTSIQLSNIKQNLLNTNKLHFKKTIKITKNNYWKTNYTNSKTLTLSLIRSPNEQEKTSIQFKYPKNHNVRVIGKIYSKKIKKIWQEFNIPPWIRNKTPLLFYNNTLITAVGIFTTQDGKIETEKKALGIFWSQKNINQ